MMHRIFAAFAVFAWAPVAMAQAPAPSATFGSVSSSGAWTLSGPGTFSGGNTFSGTSNFGSIAVSGGITAGGSLGFTSPTKSVCVTTANSAATYSAGQSVGGVLTFTSLWGTALKGHINTVTVTAASTQASGTWEVEFFDANPSASTIASGATPVLNAADVAKWRMNVPLNTPSIQMGAGATNWAAGGAGFVMNSATQDQRVVLIATQAMTLTANSVTVCLGAIAD